MKRVILLLFFIVLSLPSYSHGMEPLDVLKEAVDKVIGTLKDPKYSDPSLKNLQEEELWNTIHNTFDFNEMSMRTLAKHWRDFDPQQRKEFSEVFGKFLGNTYLSKMQTEFKNEKVAYLGQELITERKAFIKTKLIRETLEIPIDYSMLLRDNTWKVYDVKVEGVSLMKNYRAQFSSILLKESPSELIERLKRKTKEEN